MALPGDVVLCYADDLAETLRERTGSAYSHAAIVVGVDEVAEASEPLIAITNFDDLLSEFDHLVLLRHPDIWDAARLHELRDLVAADIKAGKKFNQVGFRRVELRRLHRLAEIMNTLAEVDRKEVQPPDGVNSCYFCSQFVSSLFIRIGIIKVGLASAAFDPKAIVPGDLNDGAYGFFVGYIKSHPKYRVPESDEFRYATPYHEIGWHD